MNRRGNGYGPGQFKPLVLIASITFLFASLLGCEGQTTRSNSGKNIDNGAEIQQPADDDSADGTDGREVDELEDEGECLSDFDCREAGPWRSCQDGSCTLDTRNRTLMLGNMEVGRPASLRGALNETLGDAISAGQLNLLVHLGESENWMIQGVPSGSIEGSTTYGQSEQFGAYCGEGIVACENDICTAHFRPESEGFSLLLHVRDSRIEAEGDACAYQILELVDTSISVVINLQDAPEGVNNGQPTSIITLDGYLPSESAKHFIMGDGTSLMDLMDYPEMEKDTPDSMKGDGNGWRVELSGVGHQVVFDNDPTAGFDGNPSEPIRQVEAYRAECK